MDGCGHLVPHHHGEDGRILRIQRVTLRNETGRCIQKGLLDTHTSTQNLVKGNFTYLTSALHYYYGFTLSPLPHHLEIRARPILIIKSHHPQLLHCSYNPSYVWHKYPCQFLIQEGFNITNVSFADLAIISQDYYVFVVLTQAP